MTVNSHCWLRTALQRLQCIFIILWKYSNKRRTGAAALIRGRRLLTIPLHVRRLIEGGAYSGAALIRVNTVLDRRNVENWTQSGRGKKKQCKEIGRISVLQPVLRERGRNSQYRQYGFMGTFNPCEICDVVNQKLECQIKRKSLRVYKTLP